MCSIYAVNMHVSAQRIQEFTKIRSINGFNNIKVIQNMLFPDQGISSPMKMKSVKLNDALRNWRLK